MPKLNQFKKISRAFWFDLNPENTQIFLDLLRRLHELFGKSIFATDNMICFKRNCGFLEDPRFRMAFDKNALDDIESTTVWREHIVCWAADNCLNISGDFVECGVYKGFTSRTIVDYTNFKETNKSFYLYDVFEHIDDPGVGSDCPELGKDLVDKVRARFADIPNVQVIQGKVPDSLHIESPDKIAFMHIDMNNAQAERGALEVLWDKVSVGGTVIFDDYGWTMFREQKEMIDEFLAPRDHRVVELPTGQGMVIKNKM